MAKQRPQEFSPENVVTALDMISAWIRGVRRAVAMMDPNITTRINWPRGIAETDDEIPGIILDGCGPKPVKPPRPEGGKKGKKKR